VRLAADDDVVRERVAGAGIMKRGETLGRYRSGVALPVKAEAVTSLTAVRPALTTVVTALAMFVTALAVVVPAPRRQ